MSPEDLDRIERELAITLPKPYRARMSPFPVPACTGNADRDLWDDADELIQWNRSLRAGAFGAPPWPSKMFALGTSGASSCYVVDLDANDAPVWWVDHFRFDAKGSGIVSPTFEAWLEDYVRDLRDACITDGVHPEKLANRLPVHDELFARYGFADYAATLRSFGEPCFAGRSPRAGEHPRSWLGGYPRVDDGFSWPTKDGHPLSFVAQLRCRDVGIEAEGFLLFFYDERHHGYDRRDVGGFAVLHQQGERDLGEGDLPALEAGVFGRLFGMKRRPRQRPRIALMFDRSFSYAAPELDSPLLRALEAQGGFDDEGFWKLEEELTHDIQVGGLAAPTNSDWQTDLQAICAKMLGVELEDCILLLQLRSFGEFQWGDAGGLYWYIRRDDLAAARFDEAWMVMNSC